PKAEPLPVEKTPENQPGSKAENPSQAPAPILKQLATRAKIKRPAVAEVTVHNNIISASSPELTKEPSFQRYYADIQDRIQAEASRRSPGNLPVGEVGVVFVISKTGQLAELSLVPEESVSNRLLLDHALASVREAAPFQAFPKDIENELISFHVIFAFEPESLTGQMR
ncbi:MAG: hypothetical protein JW937_02755, partial [Candidatus Omnitrophica bacterium]|nr:hypothetical protein [Candidatus Omnitrophota bacterium]